jgi:tripartite-type tricarboxylate transporter receptor subunit TctC
MRRGSIQVLVFAALFSAFLSLSLSPAGWAQQYPTKTINMIVGWGAGGSTDVTLRALSDAAGKLLGQPIIIQNKPGGGSAVGLALLKNEKPDGYTLGNISSAGITGQHLRKVPYDSTKDFTPIIRYGDYIHGITVRAEAPWKNIKELVAYARANPGKLKYSSPGTGSSHHLVVEALGTQEGVKWTHIPYKSGHEATTALLGGHVDFQTCASEWKPYVDSGAFRLLATTGEKRYDKYTQVPTLIDQGYQIWAITLVGVIGPKGMPAPIVDKLHAAFKQSMDNPEFKKAMSNFDMPIVYRGPEGLLQDIKEISDRWGRVIQQLGLRQD